MYYAMNIQNTRKRSRQEDDDATLHGFSEHRRILKARDNTKRSSIASEFISQNQITSSLVIRPVTNSPPRPRSNAMSQPRGTEITPNGSDSEDRPNIGWNNPYHTSPAVLQLYGEVIPQEISLSDWQNNLQAASQRLQGHDSMDIDEDMDDSPQLSQPSHMDPSIKHAGRIPTPITGHFPSHVRTSNRSLPIEEATSGLKYDRRLPSPISEDESSHKITTSFMADMQRDMETRAPARDGLKKYGSTKLGIRNMGHVPTGMGDGFGSNAKKLSMGYKSDCEKCRQRVPGHYMHLIA
ncbi:hypothetical protein VC83_07312 [Pseudogymnoascus destructans]|uniref:Uncharacterized protein n=2 Tax=Pseudogymnoascus destructans TaxID=655981 RepID=L8FS49_PSED2|nr:uncharacterized protein VC83_07312 [Pseudogymnoascus destructans]ELR03303.1 hypothetical protein GMDG_06051 [Pseudogymnoascus destructans 20631-21]OAF56558.1 hypothetical protein VC83_07312 [Pseudogymnoascus destructans]